MHPKKAGFTKPPCTSTHLTLTYINIDIFEQVPINIDINVDISEKKAHIYIGFSILVVNKLPTPSQHPPDPDMDALLARPSSSGKMQCKTRDSDSHICVTGQFFFGTWFRKSTYVQSSICIQGFRTIWDFDQNRLTYCPTFVYLLRIDVHKRLSMVMTIDSAPAALCCRSLSNIKHTCVTYLKVVKTQCFQIHRCKIFRFNIDPNSVGPLSFSM